MPDELDELLAQCSESQALAVIHGLTCKRLVEALKSLDTATPGMIQAALRFLKDNGVTATTANADLQELRDEVASKAPFRIAQ